MPRLLPFFFAYIKWFNSHNDPKHWNNSRITFDWENRVTCTRSQTSSGVARLQFCPPVEDCTPHLRHCTGAKFHEPCPIPSRWRDGEMRDRLGGPCGQPKDMGTQQSRRDLYGDTGPRADVGMISPFSPLKSLSRASFSSLVWPWEREEWKRVITNKRMQ